MIMYHSILNVSSLTLIGVHPNHIKTIIKVNKENHAILNLCFVIWNQRYYDFLKFVIDFIYNNFFSYEKFIDINMY